VNDLLTLARADTGEIKLKKEIFSLTLVTRQVIHSLKTTAEQKKINVQFDITDPIDLNADPERIHQLLYILIDNGLKYSPASGEVVVYLEEVQEGTVSYVKIVVEDTGPGIPLKFQKQIFKRFFSY
jgi:two-component system sensor histidine kinase CiaH